MKNLNDNGGPVPNHIDDPDLIAYLDGELLRSEQEDARAHLESCWQCRSRLSRVEDNIENFLRLRQAIAPVELPPSDSAILRFRQRLAAHSTVPVSLRFRYHMLIPRWRNLIPDSGFLLRHKKPALASALAVIVLSVAIFDPLDFTLASADELLTRAGAYEFLHESPGTRVVRSTVRIDRINRSRKTEQNIGRVETAFDNASSSVYVAAESASGISGKQTLPDRETLGSVTFFYDKFSPQLTRYLSEQKWFPQVSASAYRRLIAARGLSGQEGAFSRRQGKTVEIHHGFKAAHDSGIKETVLLLNASSYAPQGVSILANEGGEDVEYRLTRTSFESLERSSELAQLFEVSKSGSVLPNSDLLKSGEVETRNSKLDTVTPSARLPVTPSPTASAELEVEVLRLLNSAGADLGEQVDVTRTAEGSLRVSGIVETEQRKNEILRALQTVKDNPAVRVEVQTVAEAISQRAQNKQDSRRETVEGIEIAADTFPAYADLRASMTDEEARVFAARVVSRSHSAMRHAWALKRLMAQFSPEALRSLPPEAHAKWLALIQSHARSFERETASLRQQLQPIFSSGVAPGGAGAGENRNDAELARAVTRLVELASVNYDVVRSAFTVTREPAVFSAIKTPQFWQSLRNAEAVAASIQRSH